MEYRYNIYDNKNNKINKNPLKKEDIDLIMEKKVIYKYANGINNKLYTKDLQIKKCIII